MAEMEVKGGESSRHSGTRSKKLSTRIDLTPMVDLGFLLITFFMLTTTLQKPKTMNLYLPKKVQDQKLEMKIQDKQALTVLLGSNNQVFYYEGLKPTLTEADIKATTFANNGGIRDELLDKWKRVIQDTGGQDSMMVIIKPSNQSTYQNMVAILDEMNIDGVQKYALTDISPVENDLIKKMESGH
ncbi:MAG TPA: biopolymer transporter ExbD [Chitinophagaceae bacterium]|nr:biopolymer transporter ExbD [Chitinophagaceae bacterium]